MRTVVIIGPIAVTTEHWVEHQPDGTQEEGCRLELRRIEEVPMPVPPPVPRRDAVHWIVGAHLWRADLFWTVGLTEGFDCAHYHPVFQGPTPCDRVFDPAIPADPEGWATARLGDIPGMLREAGHPDLADTLDPEVARQAMPAILAGLRAGLAFRDPARPAGPPPPSVS